MVRAWRLRSGVKEATESDVKAEFADLIGALWKLYAEQLAMRQRIEVLQNAAADLDRMEHIISARENAGAASRYDVMRIRLEARNFTSRLDIARTEAAALAAQIGVELGLRGWKPQASGQLASLRVPSDVDALWQQAEQNNPNLETARREQRAADASIEQAQRERWPVPSLLLGTAFTDRPYGQASYAGVSVEVPLFDRNQGGIAKAAASKQAAMTRQAWLFAKTRDELERAVELLERRRSNLARCGSDAMAQLPTLKQMAEDAYRLGQSGLLELLDATRSRTDTQLTHLDLLLAEVEAEIETLSAAGLLVSASESPAQ